MKIALHGGRPASQQVIARLERGLGFPLSSSFKDFLEISDGAEPETNQFKITDDNSSGVNKFIPASDIQRERTRIRTMSAKAYPFAWAEGGNYVFIDEDQHGAVFFWDHELPDSPVQIAPNFGVFLDILEPFDIRTIQVRPEQVKKVWVSPELLKKLKR